MRRNDLPFTSLGLYSRPGTVPETTSKTSAPIRDLLLFETGFFSRPASIRDRLLFKVGFNTRHCGRSIIACTLMTCYLISTVTCHDSFIVLSLSFDRHGNEMRAGNTALTFSIKMVKNITTVLCGVSHQDGNPSHEQQAVSISQYMFTLIL